MQRQKTKKKTENKFKMLIKRYTTGEDCIKSVEQKKMKKETLSVGYEIRVKFSMHNDAVINSLTVY